METKLLILSACLFSLIACKNNPVSNVEKMKTGMDDMKSTTEKMSETTDGMSKRTDDLLYLTRKKEAQESRQRNLEYAKQATTFELKTAYAAVFFKSFEFQTWTDQGKDTPAYLEELKNDGAKEFVRVLAELSKNINVNNISPLEAQTNNEVSTYMAFAVTSHYLDSQQELMIEEGRVEKSSILDMIVRMLKEATLESDQNFSSADLEELHKHEDALKAFLKNRMNMLAAIPISKIAKLIVSHNLGNLPTVNDGVTFDSNFSKFNRSQQKEILEMLGASIAINDLLRSLDIPVSFDSSVRAIYSNMDISENEFKASNGIETFRRLIETIKKD